MSDDRFDLTEAHRRLSNVLRYGTVSEIQGATARVLFDTDSGWESDFLPVHHGSAGRVRRWSPLTVGEQVSVLSPSGVTEAGVILRGLGRDQFPAPSTAPDLEVLFLGDDGGEDTYDLTGHVRTLLIPAGGKLQVNVGAASLVLQQDSLVVTIGGSTLTIQDGSIAIDASDISLAGGGPAVARVGDQVDLNTGLIVSGSDKVSAG